MTAAKALWAPLAFTAPLGMAAGFAGLNLGFSKVWLSSSHLIMCGSAFGGGTGTLNAEVEAACAPILSEKDNWATTLVFVGLALLVGSGAYFLLALSGPRQVPNAQPSSQHVPPAARSNYAADGWAHQRQASGPETVQPQPHAPRPQGPGAWPAR
jgi:hypothetical protein